MYARLQQLGGFVYEVPHYGPEALIVHSNARDAGFGGIYPCAQIHARVGAAGACAADNIVEPYAQRRPLLYGFPCGVDIAKRAYWHRAAHWHAVGFVAFGPQFAAYSFHLGINIGIVVGIHKAHVRAQKVVNYLVAQLLPYAPLFEHQHRAQAQPVTACGGQHGVVALRAAGGKHIVAALRHGVGN